MELLVFAAAVIAAFASLGPLADRFGADSRDSFDPVSSRGLAPRWT